VLFATGAFSYTLWMLPPPSRLRESCLRGRLLPVAAALLWAAACSAPSDPTRDSDAAGPGPPSPSAAAPAAVPPPGTAAADRPDTGPAANAESGTSPAPRAGDRPAAPEPAELAALVRMLGDPDWERREKASEKLSALGEDALPALQAALRDDDSEVRARAAMVIDVIRLGVTPELRARVGTLLNGFDARPPEEKREVLDRLVRDGDRAALPALERILRAEKDESIQEEALRRLEGLDESAGRKALERLARSPAARPWHVEALARRLSWQGDLAGALAAFEAAAARGLDRPSLRLAHAETLFAAGLPARAVLLLEALESAGALPTEPDERARARYWLAESLFAVRRFADALPRYTAAARDWRAASEEWTIGREDPFTMAAQRVGECLRRLGRSAEAEAAWADLLDAGPEAEPAARLRLAELLRRDGQADRAAAIARDALRADGGGELTVRNRAAQLLAYAGRHAEALAIFRALLRDDGRLVFPQTVEQLLRVTGRPAEALAVRKAELTEAPDDIAQHLEVASAAEKGELFDEAVALYKAMAARFPAFPMPRQRLAELYARLGEPAQALALDPLPVVLALRCHEALGQIDAGIALGERHLEDRKARETAREESDLQLVATLARLHRLKGQPQAGIARLTGARGDFRGLGRSFDYHYELGRLREEARDLPGALAEYLLAWHHSGLRAMDVQEARRRAGYLAAQAPDAPRAALEAIRRRAGIKPDDEPALPGRAGGADALLVEGELLALAGDPAGAAAAYERADAVLPRKPGTGCRAADLLARAGRPDEARRRLERVAAEWPDDPTAFRHLARLARAAGDTAASDAFRAKADVAGALDKKTGFEAAHHFMTHGLLDEALAEWRKVAAAPGERFYYETNAHEYLGHLLARAGDGAGSAGWFRRMIDERELRESGTVEEGGVPYAALVHAGTGRAAEARGDRATAEAEYTKALRLASRDPDTHEALARVAAEAAAREAHRAAAAALWREQIADAPRDPEPRYRLARLLIEMPPPDDAAGARDEARRLAREARERFPGEARYEKMVRRTEGEPPPLGR
jgi:predicted Zn-dependent protease